MYQLSQIGGMRSKGLLKKSHPNKPLITVVTVVFNGQIALEETILSVINQKYENIEYIIIDGGSSDGTLDIIKKYDSKIDYWISEKDSGIYDAMNKAITIASGDWLIFIGSDDELIISIDSLVNKMIDHKSVYYGDVILKKTKLVSGGKFNKYKIMQRNICHQAIFYPRYVYFSNFYDVNVGMLADYKYNLMLFGRDINFKYVPVTISCFNEEGLSSGDQTYFIPLGLAIIKNSFGIFYYRLKIIRSFVAKVVKAV